MTLLESYKFFNPSKSRVYFEGRVCFSYSEETGFIMHADKQDYTIEPITYKKKTPEDICGSCINYLVRGIRVEDESVIFVEIIKELPLNLGLETKVEVVTSGEGHNVRYVYCAAKYYNIGFKERCKKIIEKYTF